MMGRRKKLLDGLDAEIRDHLERETQLNLDRGMAPEAARRAALLKFGNIECAKEDTRAVWTIGWLAELRRDLGFGLRLLRRSPGFAAVAIVTLALGIGANTAIFSAVNGILNVPLPYADSSRLVQVWANQIAYPFNYGQFSQLRQQTPSVEQLTPITWSGTVSLGSVAPEQVEAAYAAGGFFSLLGTKPLLGRYILPRDTEQGADRVAVLNYALWMSRFGGDARIVGRSVSLDDKPYTVIGVMPKLFGLGVNWDYQESMKSPEMLWLPEVSNPHGSQDRLPPLFVARLAPGATLAQARAQLKVFTALYSQTLPAYLQNRLFAFRADPLSPKINPQLRSQLLMLWGAVGFVLLMACVNVTALLVARSWTRQQELTIRKALGATRVRIVRQLLSEALLFALGGGALGVLVAVWGAHALRALAPSDIPRVADIQLDATVLWFTLGISLVAAVLVGLAPALQATSRRAEAALKGGLGEVLARTGLRRTHRLRSTLVVAEVLLAVIVVVGGALMARSFYRLMTLDTGLQAAHVITMDVQTPPMRAGCGGNEKATMQATGATNKGTRDTASGAGGCVAPTSDDLLAGVRSIVGVQGAALFWGGLFGGGIGYSAHPYPGGPTDLGVYIEGHGRRQLEGAGVGQSLVTPGYFATLGIRLLRGRYFDSSDATRRDVAVVSEGFARTYIPGNPLGKYFSVRKDEKSRHFWIKIVGVANDVRDRTVYGKYPPINNFYTPLGPDAVGGSMPLTLVARTEARPTVMLPEIEHVVRSVDKGATIRRIATVDEMLAQSSAEPRFETMLLGSFAVLGLLLAIVGVYGVISYAVVQRTHEIGVRMALGAQRADILGMVLREGMLLAVLGVVLGIAGALAVTRVLRNMLFEVTPSDPATLAAVAVLLLLAAFLACWIPARRAMRVDPTIALRYE